MLYDNALHIRSWADLRQFGINALTGEACAYNLRLLCDVSEQGATHVAAFLGLPVGTKFNENWNTMVGDQPAIGSVMLPRSIMIDLAAFIARREIDPDAIVYGVGTRFVSAYRQYPVGSTLSVTDDFVAAVHRAYGEHLVEIVRRPSQPDRNTHAMSGRTA